MMPDIQQHMAKLRSYCQRASDTCIQGLHVRLKFKPDDHIAFMLATFAPIQVTHLDSVIHLVAANRHAQAGILARTMLEGYGILHWCYADVARAHRWRGYALVHDLRLLLSTPKEQLPNWEAHKQELLLTLREFAPLLLKPQLRGRTDDATLLNPKSYENAWHVGTDGKPISISKLIQEGLSDPILREMYGSFSAYVHWGVTAIAHHLQVADNGWNIQMESDPREGAAAMAMAFQACGHSFELFATHYELADLKASIVRMATDYVADFRSLGPPSSAD